MFAFFGVLGGLIVIDVLLAAISVPTKLEPFLTLLVTMVYVGAPIWALYKASSENWTWKQALVLIVAGLAVHIGTLFLIHPATSASQEIQMRGLAGVVSAGLLTWCLGLGALLACLIREKHLILPIAIVLAAMDIFVILTPGGPTRHIMEANPRMFINMAYSIPVAGQTHIGSGISARIGPADIFLVGMFFIALQRFGMRTEATLRALVPTLVGYMLAVMIFGDYRIGPIQLGALPALVPIGAVILFVNRKEFTMSKEERGSTAFVAILGLCLIVYGATRQHPSTDLPTPQPGLSRQAPVRAHSGQANLPVPVDPSQPPFGSPTAPTDKPSPR